MKKNSNSLFGPLYPIYILVLCVTGAILQGDEPPKIPISTDRALPAEKISDYWRSVAEVIQARANLDNLTKAQTELITELSTLCGKGWDLRSATAQDAQALKVRPDTPICKVHAEEPKK